MRQEIKALTVRFGLPIIWMILNPSDLTHPLVCQLAGISIPIDIPESQKRTIRINTAIRDPVASATFFNIIISLFFSKVTKFGAFGKIEAYYGTTESNGRGALHLHTLI